MKEDCYGFYPATGGKGTIDGPGIVENEFNKNPARFSEIVVSLSKPISLAQRSEVLTLIRDWNRANYQLLENNCVLFVASMMKHLGWNVVSTDGAELPAAFLRRMREANEPGYAVVGSWNGTATTDNETVPLALKISGTPPSYVCGLVADDEKLDCSKLTVNDGGAMSLDLRDSDGNSGKLAGNMDKKLQRITGTITGSSQGTFTVSKQ